MLGGGGGGVQIHHFIHVDGNWSKGPDPTGDSNPGPSCCERILITMATLGCLGDNSNNNNNNLAIEATSSSNPPPPPTTPAATGEHTCTPSPV